MKEVPLTLAECGINLEWKNGRWYCDHSISTYFYPAFADVESLPDDLTINGSLNLAHTKITHLPKGLKVMGNLHVYYSLVKELPADLYVAGHLGIVISGITSIPTTMRVDGIIFLGKSISKLPDNLTIENDLYLPDTFVSVLPKGLHVKGGLDITGMDIKELPDDLIVDGGYYLNGSAITALPDNMQVNGSLNIVDAKITSLPKNLKVKGDLDMQRTGIAYLPDDFVVGGDLLISDTLITSLPNNLVVGGDLICDRLPLTNIPDNLVVGGTLQLTDTKLTSLPDNFIVGGNLDISFTPIKKLPKNLTVKGWLNISYADVLPLPEDLVVGGKIYDYPTNARRKFFRNNLTPKTLLWHDGKYIKIGNMLVEVVSHRGNVYRARKLNDNAIFYLVTDGNGKWEYGNKLSEAKESLIYKIDNNDVRQYKYLYPNSKLNYIDAITCYRVITGASISNTKHFVENCLKPHKRKYSISEIAELSKGEYGNIAFKKFFNIE